MKILFFISVLLLLPNCANQNTAPANESVMVGKSPLSSPTTENKNQVVDGNLTPLSSEDSTAIDEAKRREEEIQTEKLKRVPKQLKKVDFGNFKYPANKGVDIVPLKNGGYEFEYPHSGGETYGLKEVFYTDLTGDDKKEAIVQISVVSCGGSCDGGSNNFYVYTVEQNKLKMLWHFETGSLADGGGLKSFRVKNKRITVDEFGKCSAAEEKVNFQCTSKFASKNVIRLTFGFNGKKIARQSEEIIAAPIFDAKNYRAAVSIEE